MLFYSAEFIIFLVVVFSLYWAVKGRNAQNLVLCLSGAVFYGYADVAMLLPLLFSAAVNYFLGIRIGTGKTELRKQLWLYTGVVFNVGILCYFKYFGFFYGAFSGRGTSDVINVIIPVGISFYTFLVVGYLVDVFQEEVEPCRDKLAFGTFVLFFPKLLSGPIERSTHFLPQVETDRSFNAQLATDGMRQFLWGLFAKIAIADSCARLTDPIFGNVQQYSSGALLAGLLFYAFQVYCDFAGYSNMAIGIGKLFGIRLLQNFATPFFSVNISDFWKRWHISLSTWMLHYVYTPLSFLLRRWKKAGLMVSIIFTFLLVGLWHGANWTFIVFGLLHGLYFVPLILRGSHPVVSQKSAASKNVLNMIALFLLVMVTMVFFRAESVSQAFDYLHHMFILKNGERALQYGDWAMPLFFIAVLLAVEWISRSGEHGLSFVDAGGRLAARRPLRWISYFLLLVAIFFSIGGEEKFIYFRF